MTRVNYSSNTKWETEVGYSRAVKVGKFIFVSGTTAVDEKGNIVGIGNVYEQARYVLQKIKKVLEEADSKLADVVRTRMFVTNIDLWEPVGRAHGEFFKDIKPASTMVEVSSLIDNNLLVEIEVEAILEE